MCTDRFFPAWPHLVAPSARSRRRRRGAAAVEMALCAPLLVLLVFGMVETGRAIMVQHLLTNAARDGARAAILEGTTASQIETEIATYLGQCSVSGATVSVTPSPLTLADIGDPVSVSCQVPYDSVSWLPMSPYFGGINLQATVVMRRETTAPTTGDP